MKKILLTLLLILTCFASANALEVTQIANLVYDDSLKALRFIEAPSVSVAYDWGVLADTGSGPIVISPNVAQTVWTVSENAADSTISMSLGGYSFANTITNMDYHLSGDLSISFSALQTAYKAIGFDGTLYYVAVHENAGNLAVSFYDSSFDKIDIPSEYALKFRLTIF